MVADLVLPSLLNAVDRQKDYLLMAVLFTAANIAANAFLIPRFGAVGAGAATLGCEAVGFAYLVWLTYPVARVQAWRYLPVPLLAGAGMTGVFIGLERLPALAAFPVALAAYAAVLFGLRGVTLADLREIWQFMRVAGERPAGLTESDGL
jgi:O-antigen/teichoic acid export membrane protein